MVLNSYFHRVNLIDAPWNSNANRARALAAFLNFLHGARGGKSWRQASESDHLAFHQWRRRDPAGPRVAGGTWSQEVSHVNQFFEWAVRQHQIGAIPIPHRSRRPAPPGTLQAARAGSTVPATREQAVPLAARPGGEDGQGPRRTARPAHCGFRAYLGRTPSRCPTGQTRQLSPGFPTAGYYRRAISGNRHRELPVRATIMAFRRG